MFTALKRIFRSGFTDFWRNSVISVSSVFVMTITLSVIGSVVFLQKALNVSLEQIKEKVDVNVSFIISAEENDILAIKSKLETLPEVETVEYRSREQVYDDFKDRHENDQLTLQALEELGENPLGALLNIRAKETSHYESIAHYLNSAGTASSDNSQIIDRVNYYENKGSIDKLTQFIETTEKLGIIAIAILVAMSLLITFNTIRLAIYSSRDEITIMRLVGASPMFARGPFVIEGIMSGVFSGVIALAIFYPLTYWLADATANFFGGLNFFEYYVHNFGEFLVIIIGSGMLLGGISSFLAVRKYLRV